MLKDETKLSEYFELPNPNLRAYFGRVRQGQPDEYRTPFYKGKSVPEILADWRKILEASEIPTKWPSLMAFENDLAKKVGPMSIMKPLDQRMEDIDHYYSGVLLPGKPLPSEAFEELWKEWGKFGGLRIRSVDHTLADMRLSTNSGSPFFRKRRKVIDDTIPVMLSTSATRYEGLPPEHFQSLRKGVWLCTAVLGWRGQEGGPTADDVKQRVVWMFPFAVNIEELRVYQPLIVALQRPEGVPAWISMDAVDVNITKMFDTKGNDDLVICTDFSKFDQHFNPFLQTVARHFLMLYFKGDPGIDRWLREVFPIKYEIPLAYDYGKIRRGYHGMASGSGGTNADETIAHRALQHEAAMRAHSKLNLYSQCLGDDGILTFPGCTVDSVVDTYTSHGLEMNPDKQYASTTDCVYLRRWHHVNYRVNGVCVGVYSTFRALGRLAEQERYYDPDIWGPKMVALRALSIIENCKYHPLREQFADFCIKGDKYRLGIDIPGFLDNIKAVAKEAIDLMPDFLGYTKSLGIEDLTTGIENWWIVKYLKSKR